MSKSSSSKDTTSIEVIDDDDDGPASSIPAASKGSKDKTPITLTIDDDDHGPASSTRRPANVRELLRRNAAPPGQAARMLAVDAAALPSRGKTVPGGDGLQSLSTKSLYDVFGVKFSATKEQVRKAFGEKAALHHPDVPGGDKDLFSFLSAAYPLVTIAWVHVYLGGTTQSVSEDPLDNVRVTNR